METKVALRRHSRGQKKKGLHRVRVGLEGWEFIRFVYMIEIFRNMDEGARVRRGCPSWFRRVGWYRVRGEILIEKEGGSKGTRQK